MGGARGSKWPRAAAAFCQSGCPRNHFSAFIVSLIGPKKPANDADALAAFVAFESNMRFGWDMWAWARLHAAHGGRNTYVYRFAHNPPNVVGASHGAEMPYVFDHLEFSAVAWTEDDRRIARTMAAYWTNFAKTGDPNGNGLPEWTRFTSSRQDALVIRADIHAGAISNEPDLAAIDRLYLWVRVVLRYGVWILGAAVLLLVVLVGWIAARLLRRRKSPACPAQTAGSSVCGAVDSSRRQAPAPGDQASTEDRSRPALANGAALSTLVSRREGEHDCRGARLHAVAPSMTRS